MFIQNAAALIPISSKVTLIFTEKNECSMKKIIRDENGPRHRFSSPRFLAPPLKPVLRYTEGPDRLPEPVRRRFPSTTACPLS
jgi:hypothetical protein